ncbi:MAG: DUF2254 domain-containing protein [Candidatus Melainabacteria bacterium HGW-Melainabacteria-1]|nr:MAG: DUF2254 domain-containing protein [Candidatus Melainabacteria bacterium HGW-Melainabacteria-1]
MMQHLIKLYMNLSASFWFVPAVMMLLAAAAALGSTALDQALGSAWVNDIGWVWSGGADGARSVLSTVAGSLMTVVSVVFSLTITTLAQTSSHFGPRVLRNFIADRGNQLVLGTFVATFLYCLLVLRTIRSVQEQTFVPYLSVNLGLALTVASLAVLIYFIHHLSQSIQAEQLIAGIGKDFEQSLPMLFPEQLGHPDANDADRAWLTPERWAHAWAVCAETSGYIQHVDEQRLMSLASGGQLLLRLTRRPGDFVSRGAPLLHGLPGTEPETGLEEQLCACFVLGRQRTPYQDASFYLQQLIEIALRALSPGINEPYTALCCIDWLGACLRGMAGRPLPSPMRRDVSGQLCVIAPAPGFDELARSTLGPLRLAGAGNPDVVVHLLQTLAGLAPALQREADRRAIHEQARLLGQAAADRLSGAERDRIEPSLRETLGILSATKPVANHNPDRYI